MTAFTLSPGATATEFNDVVGTANATAGARPREAHQVVATARSMGGPTGSQQRCCGRPHDAPLCD